MADVLERASAVLTNTNATDIYAVPNVTGNERALVIGLNVCNVSSNTADVIISIVNSGGATISRYAHKEALLADSRQELIEGNGKLVLKAGERLRGTASIGNAFEITASLVVSS
jgi:hypothetical protein